MPMIVPRSPGPTVQPNRLPDARNTARVDMSPLVRGVGQIGAAVTDVVEQQKNRIDTARTAQARTELESWWNTQRDPNTPDGLHSFKGEQALKAEGALVFKLQKERDRIAQGMTPSQRQQFDLIADNFRENVRGSIGSYAAAQNEAAIQTANGTLLDTLANSALRYGLDGEFSRLDSTLAELDGAAARIDTNNGLPAETSAQLRAMRKSGVLKGVIIGSIAKSPEAAGGLYERLQGQLTGEDQADVERALLPSLNASRVESAARTAIDGGMVRPAGPGTTQAVQAEADDMAKRFGVTKSSGQRGPRFAGDRSQHIHGMAADFAGAGIQGENGDKLIAHARAQGYHVLDERTRWNEINPRTGRPYGTGPNIHIEWRGGKVAPAESLADALERLRQSPVAEDPKMLRQAEMQVRSEFAYRKLAQDEADRDRGDAIFAKMTRVAPTVPLSKALDANDLEFLARNPEAASAVERWRSLVSTGAVVKDDPVIKDELARMRVTDPGKFRATNLLQYSDRLSGETLLALSQDQRKANDPEKQADWASESERLDSAYRALGLAEPAGMRKPEAEQVRRKRAAFAESYRQSLRLLIKGKGGQKATPDELDRLISSTVARFHKNPERFVGNVEAYGRAGAQAMTVDLGNGERRTYTGQDVAEMRAALIRANKPATEEDVLNALAMYR